MSSLTRQYLFGLLFIGVAIFQAVNHDYLEFFLYVVAGSAFIVNALTLEKKLIAYRKALVIITWILIVISVSLFLYVLQFKF